MRFFGCFLWLLPTAAFASSGTFQNDEASSRSDGKQRSVVKDDDKIWRFPLEQISGTQHVNVWIGQPPVRQTWIVDTGSRFTATLCAGCRNCGDTSARANAPYAGSTTHSFVPCGRCQMKAQCAAAPPQLVVDPTAGQEDDQQFCRVRQQYTEGSSWTAWEVNDIVALDGAQMWLGEATNSTAKNENDEIIWDMAVPLPFGCQTEIKGLFRKQYADGIMGLERSNYSFVAVLHQQGLIPNPTFRLCLHPKGGWLSVGHSTGNHKNAVASRRLQYTPSPTSKASASSSQFSKKWYNVRVEAVWLGPQLLTDAQQHNNPQILQAFRKGKATILDSGTTDTFLPAALEPVLAQAWQSQTGVPYRRRTHDFTWDEFQRLPQLHLVLAHNVTWTLQPKYFMEGVPLSTQGVVQRWSNQTKMRLTNRLYADEPVGAVLGLNAMMGYEIEYPGGVDGDGTGGAGRVGIAPADCHL